MTEFLSTAVQSKIEKNEKFGLALLEGLKALLKETGRSILETEKLIKQFGAACLDVEYGAETPGFSPLNPRVLFATEPTAIDRGREQSISSVLSGMATKYPSAKIIRKERGDALTQIQQEIGGEKLGLVTWLNIFDDNEVGKEDLTDLIQKSGHLLTKGGLFVCSFYEKESSRQELLETLATTNFPGLTMNYYEGSDSNFAGKIFLIAEKVE